MKTRLITLMIFWLTSSFLYSQNRALDFDGKDDQLLIESAVTGNDDFTAQLWFKAENGNNNRIINLLSWGHLSLDYPRRFHFVISSNKLAIIDDAQDNGLGYRFPFQNITIDDDGAWHFLTIVKKGNLIRVILDDSLYEYTTERFHPFNLPESLVLGQRVGEINPGYNGLVDEVRLWNRALPDSEIQDSRFCELNGDEPGLTLYYDFNSGWYEQNGNYYVRDLAGFNDRGQLNNFTLLSDDLSSNILPINNPITGLCSGGTRCIANFNYEVSSCGQVGFVNQSIGSELSYAWDFGFIGNDSSTAENPGFTYSSAGTFTVCLTINGDECSDQVCQDVVVSYSNAPEITIAPDDIILNAQLENECMAFAGVPRMIVTSCEDYTTTYTRSDGGDFMDGYPIGTTDIVITVSNIFGSDTHIYSITVLSNEECGGCESSCEISSFVNLSTGVDSNGNELPSGTGLVDPFWRLINAAPAAAGCETAKATINGSAYLVNFVFPSEGWVNLPGATPLAPVDIGNNGRFGCDNLSNSEGNIIPYVFERAFCICSEDSYSFDFDYRGDDFMNLELINLDDNTVIATGPNYRYNNATQTWQFVQTLTEGQYAIRANLANTSATVLGFSVAGGFQNASENTNILNVGQCCNPKTINVRKIIDADCSGDLTDGDMPGENWNFRLYDEEGTLLQTGNTNINGELFFTGLSVGTYTIEEVQRPGWFVSTPLNGVTTIQVTDDSFNVVDFYNCVVSDCFTVDDQSVECNDDLTYDVQIRLTNRTEDQTFDRLLIFGSSAGAQINPTVIVDFGNDMDTLSVNNTSEFIPFTIRLRDYVSEAVEVCFDVAPQNPAGGFCCSQAESFCIILEPCCPPDDNIGLELIPNEEEDCCYDLMISNNCAEDYFEAIEVTLLEPAGTISANPSTPWTSINATDANLELIYQFDPEGGSGFIPVGDFTIATICAEGDFDTTDQGNLAISWIANEGGEQISVETEFFNVESCTEDPCYTISDPQIICIGDQKQLSFTVTNLNMDQVTAQQLVISPEGNITTDNYSPQSFENINLAFNGSRTFTIDLIDVPDFSTFSVMLTLHDYDTPLPDGTFWCCSTMEVLSAFVDCGIGSIVSKEEIIDYSIFPNPANDQFTVSFKEETATEMDINLITINGEVLETHTVPEGQKDYEMSLSDLRTAVYLIQVTDLDGNTRYQKIMKL